MESALLEKHNLLNIKAICQNSIAPLRKEDSDTSEMVSQILFGELCTVTHRKGNWRKIKADFDGYEGWIDYKHLIELTEEQYQSLHKKVQYIYQPNELLVQDNLPFPITIGAEIRNVSPQEINFFTTQFSYNFPLQEVEKNKRLLPELAFQFLNTPYLWGGKSTFGIDCSGYTQTLYKLIGVKLPRDAYQQAEEGQVLSFIEEAETGDLAFFENEEGKIIHVGIILDNQKIIHAHGKVRIDTLDYTGIFNAELQKHTHKLRFIRKIL